jgi:hypothetical protein
MSITSFNSFPTGMLQVIANMLSTTDVINLKITCNNAKNLDFQDHIRDTGTLEQLFFKIEKVLPTKGRLIKVLPSKDRDILPIYERYPKGVQVVHDPDFIVRMPGSKAMNIRCSLVVLPEEGGELSEDGGPSLFRLLARKGIKNIEVDFNDGGDLERYEYTAPHPDRRLASGIPAPGMWNGVIIINI